MTDLHTHILPEVYDGSGSLEESLALLALEGEQGVDHVVLTPHFYRDRERPEQFLARRRAAFGRLAEALPPGSPALTLGAEVAWYPSLGEEDRLEDLCLGDSRHLLLELPMEPWSARLPGQIYTFASETGLTPILAHVERYRAMQSRELFQEVLSLGLPMQMNADSLLNPWTGRKCLELLHSGRWHLGSDCHNVGSRPPRLGRAAGLVGRRLGSARARELTFWRRERGHETK